MERKLVILAAALALTPVAAAQGAPHAQQVVEGHTVFAELVPESGQMAAVAGIVQCQVLWFNNQVLFQAPSGSTGMCDDARFVYAYPAGAPDPRGNPTLKPSGREWDFTDPNGAAWHVVEYDYEQIDLTIHQALGLPGAPDNASANPTNHTAWIVESGGSIRDPTILRDYNFVVVVDLAKLVVRQDGTGAPQAPVDAQVNGVAGSYDPTQAAGDQGGRGYVTLALGQEPPAWS